MDLPTISHSTTSILGTPLYRHESHFVVSTSQVTNDKTNIPTARERSIYSIVYGPILNELNLALTTYKEDPTKALIILTDLQHFLKTKTH